MRTIDLMMDHALRKEFEENVTRLRELISRGGRCRDGHVFLNLVCVYCGAKKPEFGPPQIKVIREDQTLLSEKRVSDDVWHANTQHYVG